MTAMTSPTSGRRGTAVAFAAGLAAVTVAALMGATGAARGGPTGAVPDVGRPAPAAAPLVSGASAPGGLDALRAQVRRSPRDWPAWSALGGLELERGRASGDPAAYEAARAALATSLALQPEANDAALAGEAALAAARHDFAGAERRSRQALTVNPIGPQALATLTDALTELGRYDEAHAVAARLDALRPGVASFTRLSYQAELRGRTPEAIDLMNRAATEAGTPAEIAFARSHEGLLRLGSGDVTGAESAWRAGTALAPDDAGLLLLGARIAWARGENALAVERYAYLVERRPTPANAIAQAEALAAVGREREARAALDVARAGQALARAAGIAPEAGDVLVEADHGEARRAVALGAEVWHRSPSVGAADAYAWALHAAGRDREALRYADRALALGGRPAGSLAHRGTIRAALGDRVGAEADLREALATDPTFSALHAPRVAELLRRPAVTS